MSQIHIFLLTCLPGYLKSAIQNLPIEEDPKSLLSSFHDLFKMCSTLFLNTHNCQGFVDIMNAHFSSSIDLSSQLTNQLHVQKIKEIIIKKFGLVYSVASELIVQIFIINIVVKTIPDLEELTKKKAGELANLFNKLRFEIEIQNMNRMNDMQKVLVFEDIIQSVMNNFFKQEMTQETIFIIQQSLKNPISNIPEQIFSYFMKKKQFNLVNYNKKTISQIQKKNLPSDIVLKHIKQRENEITKEKEQTIQGKKMIDQKERKSIQFVGKTKFILKQRTIYHQRKNIYVSKKKKQMHNPIKYDSFDHSTQWSLTRSKSKKIAQEIDDQLEESFLAFQTPKPQKIFFDAPICMRLDFSK